MAISALDFSSDDGNGFGFGKDTENAVAALRKLADDIESKEVRVQSVRVTGLVSPEEFTSTIIHMVLGEKVHPRKARTED